MPFRLNVDIIENDDLKIIENSSGDLEIIHRATGYSISLGSSSGGLYEGSERVATRTWANNNADVPNADYADSAGDADTVDGNEGSDLAKLKDGVQAPVYASKSDVPSGITEGEIVYISGDSSLYVEDGT